MAKSSAKNIIAKDDVHFVTANLFMPVQKQDAHSRTVRSRMLTQTQKTRRRPDTAQP